MKNIVIDTNALLALINDKIDVIAKTSEFLEEPMRFVVLKPCLAELGAVAKPSAFDAIMSYLKQRGASIVDAPQQRPDDAILEYAATHKECIVLSLDGALRKRLKRLGIQTITLRGAKLVLA